MLIYISLLLDRYTMSTNESCKTSVYKVCVDLDMLIVRYFETFTELFDLKQQLECTMKNGFLYMAKVSFYLHHVCNVINII